MVRDFNILAEDQTDLKPGQIKFYDHFLPKIGAGAYQISIEQSMEGDGLDRKSFQRDQQFIVDAPRFTLQEDEIHSVYPPANIQANYEGVLPQIVFRKRTLPWERKLPEDQNAFQTPWVALLLFEAEELLVKPKEDTAAAREALEKKTLRTSAISRKVSEVIDPPQDYLKPKLSSLITDEEDCYAIDITIEDFMALLPKYDELPYLAHVREVNTDQKEFLGMHADGWFSVVLANRLPKTPPSISADSMEALRGDNFVRNIAHLVSVEGFADYLKSGISLPANAKKVRLASLASWEFYCKPPEESFIKLMEKVDTGMLKVGNTENIEHEQLKNALDGGYVPLQYHTRIGEKTMAWYRGPLLPVITKNDQLQNDAFFSAESGLVYDSNTGVFDASYAVAWQIGRLLALADPHFSRSILDWKRLANYKIQEFLERKQKKSIQEPEMAALMDADEIRRIMSPEFPMETFYQNFVAQLEMAKTHFNKLISDKDLIDKELAEFPGILDEETYQNLFEEGKDLQEAIMTILFNQ